MVLSIKINTRGLMQFHTSYRRFNKVTGRLKKESDRIGRALRRMSRKLAPKFTGELQKSINYRIEDASNGYRVVLYSSIRYSHFQEFGFRPHYVPINAYVRSWLEAHMTGAPSTAPVKKPGFIYVRKHKSYLRPAVELARNDMEKILNEGVIAFVNSNLKKVY